MSRGNISRWSVLFGATAVISIASISTGCKNGGGADNLGFFIPPANLAAISSVIPNVGSVLGSNSITIIGSNFGTSATARVGNTTLVNIARPNTFTITGLIPAGSYPAGSVDVVVITSSQTAVLTGGYTFADMTFTSITPNNGPIGGNVNVTIRGTNFRDIILQGGVVLQGPGSNGANVGVLTNIVVDATFTTLTAIVPGGLPLGSYNLIITSTSFGVRNFGQVYTVGNGQSATMLIQDIRSQPGNQSPAHGPLAGGTTVVLTADLTAPAPAGFQPANGLNVSLIFPDGQTALGTNLSVSGNFQTLSFTTPQAPANFFGGPVTIRVDSSTQGFATAVNGYSYDAVGTTPAINTISPAIGPQGGGTLITVIGVNFRTGGSSPVSNVRRVTVGGVPGVGLAVQSTNQLQFVTPPGVIGAQPVVVESTTGALSNSVNFTYQQAIVLQRLNPNDGPVSGGNSVTVIGQNFTTATITSGSITIGGLALTNITVVNNTTVTGIVPPGSTIGPVDVFVKDGGGIPGMTLKLGYTYGPSFNPPINRGGFDPVSLGVAQDSAVAMTLGSITAGAGSGVQDAVVVNSTPGTGSMTLVPDVSNLSSGTTVTNFPNGSPGLGGASPFNNPIDVKVADVFGPGSQDVIVLNNGNGAAGNQSVVVLRNGPVVPGTFTQPNPAILTNTLPSFATLNAVSIDVADVNSDGRVDIVVLGSSATLQNGVGVFLQTAVPGTFTASAAFSGLGGERGAVQVRIVGANRGFLVNPFSGNIPVDMNSDGIPDVVVLSRTTANVTILAGNNTGAFSLLTTASVGGTNPLSFDVADMDTTGTLDIVTANNENGSSGTVSVLLGNGAGALALQGPFGVPGSFPAANFRSLVIGDVNYDCRPDVVVANSNGYNMAVFLGNADGTIGTPIEYITERTDLQSMANTIQVLGIQQSNGIGGVVCLDRQSNGGTNSFLTMVPRKILDAYIGDFQALNPVFTSTTQGTQPQSVTYGDLNTDGHLDMVVVNRASNNVMVFVGDGFGNFSQPFAPIPLNANTQPESVLIARVDNSSAAPGVIVACQGTNQVALLRNFGGGSLGNPIYTNLDGTGPHQVIVEDMNGDGRADLITVNQFSNNISLFLGDGTGAFVRATNSPYPVGNGPLSAAVADLDGNGSKDIAVCNFNSSDVTILLTSSVSATTVTFQFSSIQLGGLIATDPVTATTTGPVNITRGSVEPRSIAIGDLNEDGAPDIVTADGFTGTVTILYGRCRAIITLTAVATPVNPGDVLTGPRIGIAPGNVVDASALPYRMRVTNPQPGGLPANSFLVEDITGGGRPLGGDPQFDPGNPSITGLSPRLPTVFYGPNLTTGYPGDDIRNGGVLVGRVINVTSVRATGRFFAPSAYFSQDGSTTKIGDPSVVVEVGATSNPSVVKLFDMNSDGHLDIVVGVQGASQVVTFISQAEANLNQFGTVGLIQQARNDVTFGTRQVTVGSVLVGLPNNTVSPAGEFTFQAADTLIYGLTDHPANPHNGYPIFLVQQPVVAADAPVKFSTTTTGPVLHMDIAHVTLDCPPSIAVVTGDNKVSVIKAK